MRGSELLQAAEEVRVAAMRSLDSSQQSAWGQYFTPAQAASLISSFAHFPQSGTLHVLDPGAGTGILSAALASTCLEKAPNLQLHITAIERDPHLLPHLRRTLNYCEDAARGKISTESISADFILDSTGLSASLSTEGRFDLIIENPPYGKLKSSSEHRKALRSLGLDVPNLYAAFLALSVKALRSHGQILAITPRSFCNGPYFSDFRKYLLSSVSLNQIHIFNSRSSVFSDTGVLQETVIISATQGVSKNNIKISVSEDHTEHPKWRSIPYEEVVHPGDAQQFIRLPLDAEDNDIATLMLQQPCSLDDLGIQVSTGRVVDFRYRHALRENYSEAAAPLIYPGNLRQGSVHWPDTIRKPQWFEVSDPKDQKLLMPQGWYTLVKRFSTKEEKRRVVSSIWSPETHPGSVAFENHLNVFHINGSGLDRNLSYGLSAWLNSNLVDRYFRIFSGHTQVNATDLRTLRFPEEDTLRRVGAEVGNLDQSSLERVFLS